MILLTDKQVHQRSQQYQSVTVSYPVTCCDKLIDKLSAASSSDASNLFWRRSTTPSQIFFRADGPSTACSFRFSLFPSSNRIRCHPDPSPPFSLEADAGCFLSRGLLPIDEWGLSGSADDVTPASSFSWMRIWRCILPLVVNAILQVRHSNGRSPERSPATNNLTCEIHVNSLPPPKWPILCRVGY